MLAYGLGMDARQAVGVSLAAVFATRVLAGLFGVGEDSLSFPV
jgi:hypothetical protein